VRVAETVRLESARQQEENQWSPTGGARVVLDAASMTIDVVDQLDQPVGTMPRGAALGSGRGFRTSHVFLRDGHGRILLQQIAPGSVRHPGRWGSSVAAYLGSGESYLAAAQRRLAEELGVRDVALRELLKLALPEEGAHKFTTLFVASHAGTVSPDGSAIAALRWVDAATIERELAQAPAQFTPTFAKLFEAWRRFG
jgi:isopentenyl-diphosphate delta-isomerase